MLNYVQILALKWKDMMKIEKRNGMDWIAMDDKIKN